MLDLPDPTQGEPCPIPPVLSVPACPGLNEESPEVIPESTPESVEEPASKPPASAPVEIGNDVPRPAA